MTGQGRGARARRISADLPRQQPGGGVAAPAPGPALHSAVPLPSREPPPRSRGQVPARAPPPGFYLSAGPLNPAPDGSSNPDSAFRLRLHVPRSHFRPYPGSRAVEPNLKGAETRGRGRGLPRFPWPPGPLESGDHAHPCALHHLLRLLRPLARRGRHPLRPHLPPAVVSGCCSGAGRFLPSSSPAGVWDVGPAAASPPQPGRGVRGALAAPHGRSPSWAEAGQGGLGPQEVTAERGPGPQSPLSEERAGTCMAGSAGEEMRRPNS